MNNLMNLNESEVKFEQKNLKIRENMDSNIALYTRYLNSCLLKSEDTFNTTYKTYYDNMKLFLNYLNLYEVHININYTNIMSEEFQEDFTEIWERYCEYCIKKGNNRFTLRNKRVAVSTFFNWCVKRKKIMVNPFNYVDEIKVTEKDKVRESYFLTPQQIWQIKYVMKNTPKKYDLQDRLLFNIFIDSGCRISEIQSLKISQLDLNEMVFNDVRHKEGYIEPVIFFEETRDLIKEWLDYREENNIIHEYLFITNYNRSINRMSKEAIRGRVKKMGKIVDIPNFYPHSIRKTILNITGKQSQNVATALGHHKNVTVTIQHYMEKQKLKEIRTSLERIREISGL